MTHLKPLPLDHEPCRMLTFYSVGDVLRYRQAIRALGQKETGRD